MKRLEQKKTRDGVQSKAAESSQNPKRGQIKKHLRGGGLQISSYAR